MMEQPTAVQGESIDCVKKEANAPALYLLCHFREAAVPSVQKQPAAALKPSLYHYLTLIPCHVVISARLTERRSVWNLASARTKNTATAAPTGATDAPTPSVPNAPARFHPVLTGITRARTARKPMSEHPAYFFKNTRFRSPYTIP